MIKIETVIEPLAAEWDELADRVNAAPFLRPDWVAAWRAAFGAGTLEVLTVRRDGSLRAVLPLQRHDGTVASPTNGHTPQFGILAVDRRATCEAVAGLLERRTPRVTLSFLDPAGDEVAELRRGAADAGYRVLSRTLERSPYVRVEENWDGYRKRLKGKMVAELRRRRRRLEELAELSFEVVDTSRELDRLLEEGFSLEHSGWKLERATAIVSNPATRAFYTNVARWAVERGWLRLAFLRVGGRPIAFQYGIEANGVYYFLKGGYDQEYHRFAPGQLLVQAMLERAFSLGLARFEFLGVDDDWKLAWTSTLREWQRVDLFGPSPHGRAQWALEAYGRPIARRARLRRLARSLRS
jgi:CelD/BcsL family acetyltransferase involved in cellulose biosynthesis